METRNISLTIEKAKEFYNSGNASLKEVALLAFTKEELTIPEWQNIKTFEDACKYLGLNTDFVNFALCNMENIEGGFGKHLTAIYKMDIIRKALNGDWKPSLVKGKVFYPFVRFYPANKAKDVANSNGWNLGPSFIFDGKKYTMVGGGCRCWSACGVGNFVGGHGIISANAGILACKSTEIAWHMSRYFMKEIFEAVYAPYNGMYQAQYNGMYEWC